MILAQTPITISGPFRAPAQMLANQSYGGHKSVHDAESAAAIGLAGAPIEGPTHFSQFEPLAAAIWGDKWFTNGCISSHFLNMVIEGEQVQAHLCCDHVGDTIGRIDAYKADGTPVLTGTASIGPHHSETELAKRLAAAIERPPVELRVIDQLRVGQRGADDDVVAMGFDDHMGELYPFSLREKLQLITEEIAYFQPGAATPWGGEIVPIEMLSVLTGSSSARSNFKVRQPSVGLFIDLEVRLLNGPVFVGRPYRLEREILARSSSKRTESYWTRTTLQDGDLAVAEVLLHSGVFTSSYVG